MKLSYTKSFRGVTLLLSVLLVTYSSCSDSDESVEPTAEELTTALLKGPSWQMSNVTVDGVVLDLYKNLSISFTEDGKYTSVNGGVIWPAAGTWRYKTAEAKTIIREDDLEIDIEAITETSMTISFTRSGPTVFGGRNKGVSGKHVLTLGR